MNDIKRNEDNVAETKGKEVELNNVKTKNPKGVELTIDNYHKLHINLLNAINENLITAIKFLKEIRDKK